MIVHNKLVSRVNGPGRRACVWVQGCGLKCRGCWNPDTHAFPAADNANPREVADWILEQEGIEGVTFSGGEPMQQAMSLYMAVVRVHAARPDLTVGIFTGYTPAELREGRFSFRTYNGVTKTVRWHTEARGNAALWGLIESHLSFYVAGRFQESKKSQADPLRSSTNQELVLVGGRYIPEDFRPQAVEMHFQPGGLTTITGFPIGVPGL